MEGFGVDTMITLTRINSQEVWVNVTHIVTCEATPDTILTLAGGEKLRVREAPEEVAAKVTAYLRKVGWLPTVVLNAMRARAREDLEHEAEG